MQFFLQLLIYAIYISSFICAIFRWLYSPYDLKNFMFSTTIANIILRWQLLSFFPIKSQFTFKNTWQWQWQWQENPFKSWAAASVVCLNCKMIWLSMKTVLHHRIWSLILSWYLYLSYHLGGRSSCECRPLYISSNFHYDTLLVLYSILIHLLHLSSDDINKFCKDVFDVYIHHGDKGTRDEQFQNWQKVGNSLLVLV